MDTMKLPYYLIHKKILTLYHFKCEHSKFYNYSIEAFEIPEISKYTISVWLVVDEKIFLKKKIVQWKIFYFNKALIILNINSSLKGLKYSWFYNFRNILWTI